MARKSASAATTQSVKRRVPSKRPLQVALVGEPLTPVKRDRSGWKSDSRSSLYRKTETAKKKSREVAAFESTSDELKTMNEALCAISLHIEI